MVCAGGAWGPDTELFNAPPGKLKRVAVGYTINWFVIVTILERNLFQGLLQFKRFILTVAPIGK